MKHLAKIKGPRDCSLVEVTTHIASLMYQYRQDRAIFEDSNLSFEARQSAYVRSLRAFELLQNWKEVRADILKKGGATRKKVNAL